MEAKIKLINRYKKEKNAIILAHNYQPNSIQKVADYTGNALTLTQKAIKSSAEVIVSCGVNCMAESLKVLLPNKTILTPEIFAGCPLSIMVEVKDIIELKEKHPGAAVVSYINSSAELKAESDVCCTSDNALDIVNKIKENKIIFLPDIHLADYVDKRTNKEIISFGGYCPIHHRVSLNDLKRMKKKYPNTKLLVHPTCREEIREKADYIGSIEGIIAYAKESEAQEMIIGTDKGIICRLKEENPEKKFYLLSRQLNCHNMKRTKLEKIVDSLRYMQTEITVREDIRVDARKSLENMFKLLETKSTAQVV
ncbi:quinolinate synthetase [Halanaerobium saccharolyticum]|uniref:Quinolinate synthase n=1 Tax=Halanaerobium saccharolyticum TaxID=43595 RepID=A0A4R6M0G9_9FIRM|nr:quinolinate synthase NadA [Halanaerobium saccharolyticum]TDO94668.1 quinolinate synthetase [Halanaerobium saccharolyticum]